MYSLNFLAQRAAERVGWRVGRHDKRGNLGSLAPNTGPRKLHVGCERRAAQLQQPDDSARA